MLDEILSRIHRPGEYDPVVIIKNDKELSFLDKRRIEMLEDFHKKRKKMIEEFEKKLEAERHKAWTQIENYCYNKYGIPVKSDLKISDGVLFVKKETQ